MRKIAQFEGLRALVAIVAVSLLALAIGLPLLASRVDRQSRLYQKHLAAAAYARAIGNDLGAVESDAVWDAMLIRTQNGVDAGWLEGNVVPSAAWDPFAAVVSVIDGHGRLVFAREQGRPIGADRAAAIETAIAPALRQLRAREAATVAQRLHPGPATESDRISLATSARVGDSLFAVLLCRIDGATGTIPRPRDHAPVFAVLEAIQPRILPRLDTDLRLRDATLTLGAVSPRAASIPIADAEGRVIATLGWTPRDPGTALLVRALPIIAAVVGALMLAATLAYRRGSRSVLALSASEARARHVALHDPLTDLPNRNLLSERLGEALVARAGVAVLQIDLDGFKSVNDTYGHQSGDELIREVARRLERLCRPQDFCARLDGDEFAVVTRAPRASDAVSLAERILACLSEPVPLSVATVQSGVSIGISTQDEGGPVDAPEMLRRADLALNQAKSRETRFAFYEPEMDRARQRRRALETDLRAALEAGAIETVYQPQLRAGTLVGVEALARWTHPEQGAIAPAYFIPLAEECGLIEALGMQVLRRAFEDARRWPGLRVAVNLSAVQLRARGFLPRVERLVAECGARPTQFEFEITENVLIEDGTGVPRTLARLRAMGFRLALDDFGTGYSSLGYLRRFPIDKLKIDRSFIVSLPGDRVAVSLIRAIVRLGRALNLEVLAEGVETAEQRTSLAVLGCSLIQGHLTGGPVGAAEIEARFRGGRGDRAGPERTGVAHLAAPPAG